MPVLVRTGTATCMQPLVDETRGWISPRVYVFNDGTKAIVGPSAAGAAPALPVYPTTPLPPRGHAKWRQACARPATGRSHRPPAPGPME